METYTINGVNVEYDTFDTVNIRLSQMEAKRMSREMDAIDKTDPDVLYEVCLLIRDYFDTVVGEGTSDKCFGTKNNVRDLTLAYAKFVEDVLNTMRSAENISIPDASDNIATVPANREQRRAAERAARRAEAEKWAANKRASHGKTADELSDAVKLLKGNAE